MSEELFTTREVSRKTGVSSRTLNQYAYNGDIPGLEKSKAGMYLWTQAHIDHAVKLRGMTNHDGRWRKKQTEEDIMAKVAEELDGCDNKGGLYVPASNLDLNFKRGYLIGYLTGAKEMKAKKVSKGFIKGLEFALEQMKEE